KKLFKYHRVAPPSDVDAHAVAHFSRNRVVTEHLSRIAKPTGLALNHEMPQRAARLPHVLSASISRLDRQARTRRPGGVEFGQRVQGTLKRAPEPSESAGHLLRNLVVEGIDVLLATDARVGRRRQSKRHTRALALILGMVNGC